MPPLALHGAGNMAFSQGDYGVAGDLFAQSLAIRQRLGDQAGKAEMLTHLGNIAYFQGDYERARPLLVRGLELPSRVASGGRHLNHTRNVAA